MDAGPTGGDDVLLRAQAIASLRRRQAYLIHRNIYLAVNALLVVVWLSVGIGAGAWFPWPVFPIAGWGIGLFFHRQSIQGPRITETDIQREMQRLRGGS